LYSVQLSQSSVVEVELEVVQVLEARAVLVVPQLEEVVEQEQVVVVE